MLSFFSRNWFILALLALCLLAIPGLVLCVLTLLGEDGPINAWLQDNFQITYHLALAPWLTLILLLLPLLIVLLYFLKLKRKPIQVPSTFLWKKSVEDLHVNSLFQWLRDNILLVLQILVILVMIYSVLGLRFHGASSRGKHYILLIDNSASMSATDVSPSRLEWAKSEAIKEIDAAGEDDVGMVIVFNSKATTLQGYTNNKARLREAVRRIEPTQRRTRIDEALILADTLANPVRSTEDAITQPEDVPEGQERMFFAAKGISTAVHLYSDGRFPRLSDPGLLAAKQTGSVSLLGNMGLHYHRAGKKGADGASNVGIVAMNPVKYLSQKGRPDADLQKLEIFVSLRNFRTEQARVTLKLDVFAQDKLIHADQVMLDLPRRTVKRNEADPDAEPTDEPGEGETTFLLPPVDLRGNIVVHAYLAGHEDDFPLDDSAWLAIGNVRKAKVLIVGPSNPVLNAFFEQEATQKIATVERLSAADLATEKYKAKAGSGDYDLVIFDRCAPESEADMPQANTFFIDRPPPPWRRSGKALRNPYLAVGKKDHPLLRHLTTLWDVGVSEAFAFDIKKDLHDSVRELFERPENSPDRRVLPPLTKLIEAGGANPVLFTMPRASYTDLVMTFPLISDAGDLVTNWPTLTSFTIFMQNVVVHLGRVEEGGRSASVPPGEPHIIRPEAGVKKLEITPPDGRPVRVERGNRPDIVFADTDKLGVYHIRLDEEGARKSGAGSFAVNLLDPEESNIEPREQIHIGNERIATDVDRSTPREIWKWILLVAVALLMVEWYIYNRRIAV